MRNKDKYHSVVVQSFIGLLVVILSIPFIVESANYRPIFSLHFNPFALLSLLGLSAILIATGYLVRKQTNSQDNLWLLAGLISIVIFGIGEVFQRLSVYPTSALFWAQISGVGIVFAAACFFLFALNYTRVNSSKFISALLMMGAAIMAFFHANGDVFFRTELSAIHLYPWGYNNQTGPGFIANLLWTSLLFFASMVLIYGFRRKTGNKILRSQTTIFLVGIAITLFGGLIFDGLIPMLGYQGLPPMGLLFSTAMGALLVFGVIKYRIFSFSPSILSDSILSTMDEAVIVTNSNLKIEFINQKTTELLDTESEDTLHKDITS